MKIKLKNRKFKTLIHYNNYNQIYKLMNSKVNLIIKLTVIF